jgi:hypothetical protein
LIGVVPGTTGKNLHDQAEVLEQKGLTFPHPIEQALAAAAYACKQSGEDLFQDLVVRCSVPWVALYNHQYNGVCVYGRGPGNEDPDISTSGSCSSPLR